MVLATTSNELSDPLQTNSDENRAAQNPNETDSGMRTLRRSRRILSMPASKKPSLAEENDDKDDDDARDEDFSNDNSKNTNADDEDEEAISSGKNKRAKRVTPPTKETDDNIDDEDEHPDKADPDIRTIPIKELLKNKKRQRKMKYMPSTLKKIEERKKRRLSTDESAKSKENSEEQSSQNPSKSKSDQQQPQEQGEHEKEKTLQPAEGDEDDEDNVLGARVQVDEEGNIIVDQASLFVSSNNEVDHDNSQMMNTIESNALDSTVTSLSFKKREASNKWTAEENERFYEALRSIGTDFTLMTRLFPKRSRKQLKLKFKREERDRPKNIDEALNGPRVPISLNLLQLEPQQQTITTTTTNDGSKPQDADPKVATATGKEKEGGDANADKDNEGNAEGTGKTQQDGEEGNEIVGRVSDDEDAMLDSYEAPPDDFDDDFDDSDDD